MRIVIDARYVTDHFPGIGRYVYNLLLALASLDQVHTLVMLYHPALPNTRYNLAALTRHPAVRLVPTRVPPFSMAEQVRIPHMLRSMQADVYHAPYYVRPYVGVRCPSVVTLYDVIPHLFPRQVSPRARLLFGLLNRLAIRTSRCIIAISESARADIAAAYRIPRERIAVTPLAADPRLHPQPVTVIATIRERYHLPERYVLSLAANKPHKNMPGLLTAWARVVEQLSSAAPTLVIAGHHDRRYPDPRRLVSQHGLDGWVRVLPDVAEADLPALYGGAEVFVFPSLYEGFGLPPLEAMACGAPVVCSNTSSLPEVVGDAAVSVAPAPDVLAAGLMTMLQDAALRESLRAAGLRRAAAFTWQKTAAETLAVYEETFAGGRRN